MKAQVKCSVSLLGVRYLNSFKSELAIDTLSQFSFSSNWKVVKHQQKNQPAFYYYLQAQI
jgi:hypothetical protein